MFRIANLCRKKEVLTSSWGTIDYIVRLSSDIVVSGQSSNRSFCIDCFDFRCTGVGAAEANGQECEHPEDLRAPKPHDHAIIVMHSPESIFAGGGCEGSGASKGVWSEEHGRASDEDSKLEEEGNEGAVGLGDSSSWEPATPDTEKAVDHDKTEAGDLDD